MFDKKKKLTRIEPPDLILKLLKLFLSYDDYKELSGDLIEVFREKAANRSYFRASLWLSMQIVKSIPGFITDNVLRSPTLFKNYLKIAIRKLLKHKSYTIINVSGLAIGIASCLLILLYVFDELSYDSHFENLDGIYRVALTDVTSQGEFSYAISPIPLAPALNTDFPEVALTTRIMAPSSTSIQYREKLFNETSITYADSNFFQVFSLPFLVGDPNTALNEPHSVVISESIAGKYFGDRNPIGETIRVAERQIAVTGVIANVPNNTHFSFDFLISFSTLPFSKSENWLGYSVHTYVVLDENIMPGSLEGKFPAMADRYIARQIPNYDEWKAAGNEQRFFLQPAKNIHLRSNLIREYGNNGSIQYVYLLSAISLFVLLIACINFMNLTTARSAARAKEIGVRKVLGSQRTQLIYQFLTESILLTLFAVVLAVILTELVLPSFNNLTGKSLFIPYLDNTAVLPALLLVTFAVGIAAGIYPALFLSAFRPIVVLKSKLKKGSANNMLRSGLVVLQFSITVILIISTGMVYQQMEFLMNKDLGITKDQVIIIENLGNFRDRAPGFKERLLTNTNIISAVSCGPAPGMAVNDRVLTPENPDPNEIYTVSMIWGDHDFLKTFDLELVWGRDFSKDIATDTNTVILNETAVKLLGWTDLENKRVTFGTPELYSVIGVVKDFHFKSLHNAIDPLVIVVSTGRFMALKIKSENVSSTLAFVEEKWGELTSNYAFTYSFLDERFAEQYKTEENTRMMFQVFAAVAVIIGCLGLFGLSAFTAEQKTREIGIRKVLGASQSVILLLLSKEFILLIGLSFAVGAPIAYYGISQWLQMYAYHVDISIWLFFAAGFMTLGIALLTVSFQTIKAALANPVDSLQHE